MPKLRTPWLLGLIAPLLCAELALRLVSPSLPSPEPWPSVGIEVKADYAERLVGDDIDVLFLGSSGTEAGIDPDILLEDHGLSAFNGAGPYSSPMAMERWLDHSLWALEPDTIVIGLAIWGAPDPLEKDILANGFDLLTDYERETNSLLGLSELWSRRSQLREATDLVGHSVTASTYTSRGHLTAYYDGHVTEPEVLSEGRAFPGFSVGNRAALAGIVKDASDRGASVVLLIEPGGCPDVLSGCANAESEQLAVAAIAEIAESLGTELINGRDFDSPTDAYADAAHLNARGTVAYTAFIAAELESIGS